MILRYLWDIQMQMFIRQQRSCDQAAELPKKEKDKTMGRGEKFGDPS